MASQDSITRAFAVTDRSLRAFFPDDFFKRCWYAAFGMAALLEDAGVPAQVIGGDFLCTVVSSDRTQLNLQGFGTRQAGEPSHFWVHTDSLMLDLGPMYLPYESSFAAPPPPMLRWPLSAPLPPFVVYRERARYAKDVAIMEPTIQKRTTEFVAMCRRENRSQVGRAFPPGWQLKDYQSLRFAALKGDTWAVAAGEFMRRSLRAEFPTG